MSLALKIIVPLLLIGAIGWWFVANNSSQNSPANNQETSVTPPPPPGNTAAVTSDAQLNADLNAVDSDMQAASNDSAAVDSSFNDTPINQTE